METKVVPFPAPDTVTFDGIEDIGLATDAQVKEWFDVPQAEHGGMVQFNEHLIIKVTNHLTKEILITNAANLAEAMNGKVPTIMKRYAVDITIEVEHSGTTLAKVVLPNKEQLDKLSPTDKATVICNNLRTGKATTEEVNICYALMKTIYVRMQQYPLDHVIEVEYDGMNLAVAAMPSQATAERLAEINRLFPTK